MAAGARASTHGPVGRASDHVRRAPSPGRAPRSARVGAVDKPRRALEDGCLSGEVAESAEGSRLLSGYRALSPVPGWNTGLSAIFLTRRARRGAVRRPTGPAQSRALGPGVAPARAPRIVRNGPAMH